MIVAPGGIDDPAVQARVEETIAKLGEVPDVGEIVSPYSPEGARQIAPDGEVAYADIQFTVRASDVTEDAAQQMIDIAEVGEEIDGATFELGGRQFLIGSFGGSSRAHRDARRDRHPPHRVRFGARDGPADPHRAVRHRRRHRDRRPARPTS